MAETCDRTPNWTWWDNGWPVNSTFKTVRNKDWAEAIQIGNDEWGCPMYIGDSYHRSLIANSRFSNYNWVKPLSPPS